MAFPPDTTYHNVRRDKKRDKLVTKQFLKLCVLTGFRSTFNGHRIGHINCFTFEQFILLPQVEATEAHNFLKVMSETSIHPIVNNGIHHTI